MYFNLNVTQRNSFDEVVSIYLSYSNGQLSYEQAYEQLNNIYNSPWIYFTVEVILFPDIFHVPSTTDEKEALNSG